MLTEFRRPGDGSSASLRFRFPHFDRHFYLAVVAFDEAGNEGRPSNLARVYVDSATLPPGAAVGGPGDGDGPSQRPISAGKDGEWEWERIFLKFEGFFDYSNEGV